MPDKVSRSTHYLHKHNAVRPFVSVPKELWLDFQRAVDSESARTNNPEMRLSRSSVLTAMIEEWTYIRVERGK